MASLLTILPPRPIDSDLYHGMGLKVKLPFNQNHGIKPIIHAIRVIG